MAQTQTQTQIPPRFKYTFPPFPLPPPNTKITRFKDFDEAPYAIQAYSADDTKEVDGLGMETVEIGKRREGDRCKSNKRNVFQGIGVGSATAAASGGGGTGANGVNGANGSARTGQPFVRMQWAENWIPGEMSRVSVLPDRSMSRAERLIFAADQFKENRPWPASNARHSYPWVWDQFRLFTGLLNAQPVFRKATKQKADNDNDAMDEDDGEGYDPYDDLDDEDEGERASSGPTTSISAAVTEGTAKTQATPQPRIPYTPSIAYVNEDEKPALEAEAEKKSRSLLDEFAADIEGRVRTFLSGHLDDRNINGNEHSLSTFPLLISLFLSFITRSKILTTPDEVKSISRALEICEMASKELPLTLMLAQSLPEGVGRAGVGEWGRGEGRWGEKRGVDEGGREGDGTGDWGMDTGGWTTSAPATGEVSIATSTVAESAHTGWGSAENNAGWGAMDQDAKDGVSVWGDQTTPSGWGDQQQGGGAGGWGDDGWGSTTSSQSQSNALPNEATQGEDDATAWLRDVPTLSRFFPSATPSDAALSSVGKATHRVGIAEQSMRRVKTVYGPGEGPSEGVDVCKELDISRVGRVILEPWVGWLDNEERDDNFKTPKLFLPPSLTTSSSSSTSHPSQNDIDIKPPPTRPSDEKLLEVAHDPLRDDITLLVDPGVVELFKASVGMGLGGVWVQVVPRSDSHDEGGDGTKGNGQRNEQGGDGNVSGGGGMGQAGWWYMESLVMVAPSFYSAKGLLS